MLDFWHDRGENFVITNINDTTKEGENFIITNTKDTTKEVKKLSRKSDLSVGKLHYFIFLSLAGKQ